jgi:hypothetical protein
VETKKAASREGDTAQAFRKTVEIYRLLRAGFGSVY